jgi:hypothetical protein
VSSGLPLLALGVVVGELAFASAQTMYHYNRALNFIEDHAALLAQRLLDLASRFTHVRIVAHSLGVNLVLSALRHLQRHQWPQGELHLLAPAMSEPDFADVLTRCEDYHVQLYYCPNDIILQSLFKLRHGVDSVGVTGSKLVPSHNVSHHITSTFVHNGYWEAFPSFIVAKPNQNQNQNQTKPTKRHQ